MAADERLSSIVTEQAFNELKQLNEGLKAAVDNILAMNNAAKGMEVNLKGADNIKKVVTVSRELQDVNTKLTEGFLSMKAIHNGSTESIIAGSTKYYRLLQLQERQQRAQAKATKDTADAYGQLSKQYNETSRAAKNLATEHGIESKQAKDAAKSAKELHDQLKQIDASVGQNNRNVGNYVSHWNGLGNAMQQLTREAPAFANSIQTGFMAISNNIPILTDAIKQIRMQNAALRAEGKPTESVLKQMGAAFFSWGTALSIGITLLTLYGKEIVEWTKSIFEGSEAVSELKSSQEALNKAYASDEVKTAITTVNTLRENIQLAKDGFIDKQKVVNLYNDTIGKTTGRVKDLDEAEKALTKNADAYVKMSLYKAAAAAAQEEAVKELLKAEKLRLQGEQTLANAQKSSAGDKARGVNDGLGEFVERGIAGANYADQQAADKRISAMERISAGFRKKAAEIAAQNKFNIFGDTDEPDKPGKPKKAKDHSKEIERELEKETKTTLERLRGRYREEAAIQKDAVENEKLSIAERKAAYEKLMLAEVSIAKLSGAIQGDVAEETQANITAIYLKYLRTRDDIGAKREVKAAKPKKVKDHGIMGWSDMEAKDFQNMQTYVQGAIDMENQLFQIEKAHSDARIAGYEKEIEQIDKKRQAAIDQVNSELLSQSEKDKKIALINAAAQAKEDERNEKIRQEKIRQAKLDKGLTIARIAVETALAVVHQLGSGDPYTAIARGVAAGAIGAAQLATAIATPIPEFADGGIMEKDGLALTDERGKELYINKDGSMFLGSDSGPTLRHLKAGTQIVSNEELMQISKMYSIGLPALLPQNGNSASLERKLEEVKAAIIQNKSSSSFSVTGNGIRHFVQNGTSSLHILHNLKN